MPKSKNTNFESVTTIVPNTTEDTDKITPVEAKIEPVATSDNEDTPDVKPEADIVVSLSGPPRFRNLQTFITIYVDPKVPAIDAVE